MAELDIAGLDRWIPIDLDADPVDEAERLELAFADSDGIGLIAPGLAGIAAGLKRGAREAETAGCFLLALWVLTAHADRLEPVVTATLRIEPLAGRPDVDAVVAHLVASGDHVGEVVRESLATASGPAELVTWRPVSEVGGEREVSEVTTVLWLRPDDDALLTLSATSTDLLSARGVPEALAALAQGVSGL